MATVATVLAQPGNVVLLTVAGAMLGTEQIVPDDVTVTHGKYRPINWPSAGKPFSYS